MRLTFKNIRLAGWLLVFPLFGAGEEISASHRPAALSLNGVWDFKYFSTPETGQDSLFYQTDFDTENWSKIKVPGHWEMQGFGEPGAGAIPPMVGLYRTTFRLPGDMNGEQIFIRFEGVQYGYDFYVNGKYVDTFTSSYHAADFNITDFINYSKENILAVKVSVQVKGYEFDTNDCWRLSGIYRGVSIYSTPDFHILDHTVQTQLLKDNSEADVNVSVLFQDKKGKGFSGLSVKGLLSAPDGRVIGTIASEVHSLRSNFSFKVKNPLLWTAETPALYKLELVLIRGKNVTERRTQQVGIRQIRIEEGILTMNGSPLKLRGVDHHDLVPETGRTLTREQILYDLILMQKANINFIRTSHYPPDRRMLDLCDSLGFYVMCEVPFGGGDRHLTDSTYQDLLLMRAEATLSRDKNHPCVIIWSVGNENPLTSITETTGKYVQNSDPTRPICYPQMGSYFLSNYQSFPDFIDIYTPHYQGAEWVKEFQRETRKPVILTEYAHALGLSFGNLEDIWRELFRSSHFAGGAVWHFQDQGIVRRSKEPVDRSRSTLFVWKDSLTYYDTRNNAGIDGIVYSDRTPQTDYWQVRKVYSPVQVIERKLPVVAGNQTLKISIYNQYDFLNLDVLQGKWTLYKNREIAETGSLTVHCPPHDTIDHELPVRLPESPESDVWYLEIEFCDQNNEKLYEHSVALETNYGFETVSEEILTKRKMMHLVVEKQEKRSLIHSDGFCFDFNKKDLSVHLSDELSGNSIITGGLYARVGRNPKICDFLIRKSESEDIYWEPHLLPAAQLNHFAETDSDGVFHCSAEASFLRGEKYPEQKLKGKFDYSVSDKGILSIHYKLKPENGTGMLLEAGVSFALSEQITDFIWLGDGPYASYPDKYFLADYGIHSMKKGDLNFDGNRANVNVAVLTDPKGNGIAILGDHSNISVEINRNRIILSHNARLMGMGNKGSRAVERLSGSSIGEIEGEFTIIPLRAGQWPVKIKEILGEPDPSLQPFQPFYYSYDFFR